MAEGQQKRQATFMALDVGNILHVEETIGADPQRSDTGGAEEIPVSSPTCRLPMPKRSKSLFALLRKRVPDLTFDAAIQLNEQVSLQRLRMAILFHAVVRARAQITPPARAIRGRRHMRRPRPNERRLSDAEGSSQSGEPMPVHGRHRGQIHEATFARSSCEI